MPNTNADRLLSRITALHKSLHLEEDGHISSMERDLMLNYLRELYEIYASGNVADGQANGGSTVSRRDSSNTYTTRSGSVPAAVKAPPSVGVPPTPPRPAPPAATAVEPEIKIPPSPSRVQPPVPHTPPTPPPAPKPASTVPSYTPPPRMPDVPSVPVPPPPPPVVQADTAIVQAREATTPPPAAPRAEPPTAPDPVSRANPGHTFSPSTSANDDSQEAVEELLQDEGANGRFGRQSVNDLTRALSINNRVLFARDLFAGDNGLLVTTLQQLNNSRNFAEAKPLLGSLARRFEWTEETRRETAREFIEIVRRRYV